MTLAPGDLPPTAAGGPGTPAESPASASVKSGIVAVVSAAGAVTGLISFIGDVLVPLTMVTRALAVLALILLGLCVGARRIPRVEAAGRSLFKDHWPRAITAGLVTSTVILVGASLLTASSPAGGWVGSNVAAVRTWQEDVGLIQVQTAQIVEVSKEIKEDTGQIKEDTGQIKEGIGQINEGLGGLEQETSVDPRKELANLGVSWSNEAFVEALMRGDLRTVKLFLDGGMSPTVLHRDSSAALYILQPGLPDPIPMLRLLIESGFDPDTTLEDFGTPPMGQYGDGFSTDDVSAMVYADSFRGPALLWVVANRSHLLPSDQDVKIIEFLLDQGADTSVTKDYLEWTEPWLGEYAAYQSVREAVLQDR